MKTKLLTTTIALLLGVGTLQNAHADLNDGLVAHWSFDDCTGKDVSGNNHDIQFGGQAPQCVTSKKSFNRAGGSSLVSSMRTSDTDSNKINNKARVITSVKK